MAATKKPTPKKAKASAKKATTTPVKRAPRRTAATTPVAASTQEATMALLLVSLFAVLSVVFAIMAYWRYYL